jgi:hypothetical protein
LVVEQFGSVKTGNYLSLLRYQLVVAVFNLSAYLNKAQCSTWRVLESVKRVQGRVQTVVAHGNIFARDPPAVGRNGRPVAELFANEVISQDWLLFCAHEYTSKSSER